MAVNFTDENPIYFSCAEWDQSFQIVNTKALKTSHLWACIVNGILAVHTTILNSLIVVLYFKDRRLQTTANVLILALSVFDLFVALVTQPAAIVNNVLVFNEIHSCFSALTTFTLTALGVGISCTTVCFIITLERLLAICWPLRHRVLVTKSLLKKILLAEVALCSIVVPVYQNVSVKQLIAMESGSLIVGITFMLSVYLCIFVVIHKRSRAVAKKCLTSGRLEKGSQNSKQRKTSEKGAYRNPIGENNSPEIVSQDSKRANTAADRVSQDSKRADKPNDNVSQDSKRENKSTNDVSQDSKGKSNSPKYVSQNSSPQNEPPKNISQSSKGKKNLDENLSQNSNRNSPGIVSHDSNGNDLKIPDEKLKDEQSTCCARAYIQKAMLKLKQELRVCKTMSIIAGALAFCFVPRVVLFQCVLSGVTSMQTFYNYLLPWFDVLTYVNSSLNPYIYFFHNKAITEGVKKIVFGKNTTRLNKPNLPSVSLT